MTITKLGLLLLTLFVMGIGTVGCTKHKPYANQQEVDVGSTAGLADATMGAAALGVVASNRNDYYHGFNRGGAVAVYRPYRGGYYQGGRKGGAFRH